MDYFSSLFKPSIPHTVCIAGGPMVERGGGGRGGGGGGGGGRESKE